MAQVLEERTYRYPLNIWFDYTTNSNKTYHVTIDMATDKDEYDDNYEYMVEIFPKNQSKESFESAEFSGFFTKESYELVGSFSHGMNFPSELTDNEVRDIIESIIEEIDIGKVEVCAKCHNVVAEEVTYESEHGYLCEECYTEYLAQKKGLC